MKSSGAWIAIPLLVASGWALAQFRPLRYDDDFRAQRQACVDRDGGMSCWKDRPIAEGADDLRLSLGGDLRWRYEHAGNPRYGLERQDRWGVFMQRASGFADLRLGEHWRGFAQLATSVTRGRAGGPSPVDENRLDPTNLFIEARSAGAGERAFGLRVGIQELQFGTGRAIDAREGPNVRRSFDAVRAYATSGVWRVDAFVAAPRLNRAGSFDDARSRTQTLSGVYATRIGEVLSWDVYALDFKDDVSRYAQGVAQERRWSLGTRAFGGGKSWDWNWELDVQGGHFGDADIRAWSLATDTGYTFSGVEGQPRVALLLAIASGDKDPNDKRVGTLNPLYPRGNYFGDEATLGPRNFFNIHPALSWRVAPQVQLNASVDFFWRHSLLDGVYAPNGMLIRGPGNSRSRYVATIGSMGATWALAKGWTATTVVAYGRPGAFLRETGADEALSFLSLSAQYRF